MSDWLINYHLDEVGIEQGSGKRHILTNCFEQCARHTGTDRHTHTRTTHTVYDVLLTHEQNTLSRKELGQSDYKVEVHERTI